MTYIDKIGRSHVSQQASYIVVTSVIESMAKETELCQHQKEVILIRDKKILTAVLECPLVASMHFVDLSCAAAGISELLSPGPPADLIRLALRLKESHSHENKHSKASKPTSVCSVSSGSTKMYRRMQLCSGCVQLPVIKIFCIAQA